MSIIKTEAFVLKSFKYGETSKIATLFTKDFGKIDTIIKGARNYKSRLCGVIETMNYISAIIYIKENRKLQILSNAQYSKTFSGITKDFDKLRTAFRIIEYLNKSLPDGAKSHRIFVLLLDVFEHINKAEKNYINFNLYFLLNISALLGLIPEPNSGSDNDNKVFETFFTNSEFYLSNDKLETLKSIKLSPISEVEEIEAGINTLNNLTDTFERYLLMHTQGNTFYRSSNTFRQLENYIL